MIFDTETTGLPKARDVLSTNLHEWPHIVQLSYVIMDASVIVKLADNIVKLPEGVVIPPECTNIHGIDHAKSQAEGQPIEKLIDEFVRDLSRVELVVGHNVQFDVNMILAEMMRLVQFSLHEPTEKTYLDAIALMRKTPTYCTMREGTHVCAIEIMGKFGKTYLKSPKLIELHRHLFGTTPDGLHNSMVDVLACLRCYYRLKHSEDLMEAGNPFVALFAPYLSTGAQLIAR